jgi:formate hydrogenlyase transcriptional activator
LTAGYEFTPGSYLVHGERIDRNPGIAESDAKVELAAGTRDGRNGPPGTKAMLSVASSRLVLRASDTDGEREARAVPPLVESEMRARRHDMLSRLAGCLVSSTLDELTGSLTTALRPVLDFHCLDVTIFKEGTEDVLWRGSGTGQPSPTGAPTEDLVRWWVYQHQQPLCSDDRDRNPRTPRQRETSKDLGPNARSFCGLPLSTPHRRLGVLFISSAQEGVYSAEHVRFLARVADHVAVAVDNALSHAALRRERDRVELLLRLSTTIASTLEFRDLLRVVSASIRSALRCHGVGVILPDPVSKELRLYAFDLPGTEGVILEGTAVPRSAPDAVFGTGEPVVANRLDPATFTSGGAYRLATDHGVKALCDLPLISRGRIVGVLTLSSQHEGAFDPDDVEFMMRAAGQVAIAVENALAYGEIRELKETLAQEKVYLEDEIRHEMNFEEIIGQSAVLRRVLKEWKQWRRPTPRCSFSARRARARS